METHETSMLVDQKRLLSAVDRNVQSAGALLQRPVSLRLSDVERVCTQLNGLEKQVVCSYASDKAVKDLAVKMGHAKGPDGFNTRVGPGCHIEAVPDGQSVKVIVKSLPLGQIAFTEGPKARSNESSENRLRGAAILEYVDRLAHLPWCLVMAPESSMLNTGLQFHETTSVDAGTVADGWGFEHPSLDFKLPTGYDMSVKDGFMKSLFEGLTASSPSHPSVRLVIGVHDHTRMVVGCRLTDENALLEILKRSFSCVFPQLRREWIKCLLHPVAVKLAPPLVCLQVSSRKDVGFVLAFLDGLAEVCICVPDGPYTIFASKEWVSAAQGNESSRKLFARQDEKLFSRAWDDVDAQPEFQQRYVLEVCVELPKELTGLPTTAETQGNTPGLDCFGRWLRARGFQHPVTGLVEAFCGDLHAHIMFCDGKEDISMAVANVYCQKQVRWDNQDNVGRDRRVVVLAHIESPCFSIITAARCLLIVPLHTPFEVVEKRCRALQVLRIDVEDVVVEAAPHMCVTKSHTIRSEWDVPSSFSCGNIFFTEAAAFYRGDRSVSWELINYGWAPMTEQAKRILNYVVRIRKTHRDGVRILTLLKPICSCGATTILKQVAFSLSQAEPENVRFIDKAVDESLFHGSSGDGLVIFVDEFQGACSVVDKARKSNVPNLLVVRVVCEEFVSASSVRGTIILDPFLTSTDICELSKRVQTLSVPEAVKKAVQHLVNQGENLSFDDRHVFVFGLTVASGAFVPAGKFFQELRVPEGIYEHLVALAFLTSFGHRDPIEMFTFDIEALMSAPDDVQRIVRYFLGHKVAFAHPLFGQKFLAVKEGFMWGAQNFKAHLKLARKVFSFLQSHIPRGSLDEILLSIFIKRENGHWFSRFTSAFLDERAVPLLTDLLRELRMKDPFILIVESRIGRHLAWQLRRTNPAQAGESMKSCIAIAKKASEKVDARFFRLAKHHLAICNFRAACIEFPDDGNTVHFQKDSPVVQQASRLLNELYDDERLLEKKLKLAERLADLPGSAAEKRKTWKAAVNRIRSQMSTEAASISGDKLSRSHMEALESLMLFKKKRKDLFGLDTTQQDVKRSDIVEAHLLKCNRCQQILKLI